MVSRNVISLTFASLLLSSVTQLAFASGRGESVFQEKQEGTPIRRKLVDFFSKKKKEVPTSISQAPSSSPSTEKKASFDFQGEPKKTSAPYRFNPNYPPQASNIQAFEKEWIHHFLKNKNAIDPKGYYKLLLTADEIQYMSQASKRPEVSKNLQGSSASATLEYIELGEVLEASLRTTIDHEWPAIFKEHANQLYAVFVSSEFRDTTTSHVKGKAVEEKPGTIVKYAAFRWEKNGEISAIRHPLVKENILTFSVSYREKKRES